MDQLIENGTFSDLSTLHSFQDLLTNGEKEYGLADANHNYYGNNERVLLDWLIHNEIGYVPH